MFDDGFDEFWESYPRKQAKKDARKAWHQVQPSPAMRVAIREALAWQIPSSNWQRGFIPLPASYLRGERWTDQPPPRLRGDDGLDGLREFVRG